MPTRISRMVRRSGHGIQLFSSLPSTREVGTPNIMRGITSTGERATIVVERWLGEDRAVPGTPGADDTLVLPDALAPVSLRTSLGQAATRSPYSFLIPSGGGQVLMEATVQAADLASARARWRRGVGAVVWSVIGLTLLLTMVICLIVFRVLNRLEVRGYRYRGPVRGQLATSNHQSLIDSFLVGLIIYFPWLIWQPHLAPYHLADARNFMTHPLLRYVLLKY